MSEDERSGSGLATGIGIGMALGAGSGLLIENLALVFGVTIGTSFDRRRRR